jgi:hypothetical protein
MGENVYGVALVVLTELKQDGSTKTGGKVVRIDSPQQVQYSANIKEGQETELRGGDRLITTVKEDDVLTSLTATFQDAKLNIDAMVLIGGGTVTGSGESAVYDAPTMSDTSRTPFMAEIYSTIYGDGAKTAHQHSSSATGDIEGYKKVTLNYAKGRIPAFTQQDRAFLVPSYTITSTENSSTGKGPFSIETVASLPPATSTENGSTE